MPLQEAPDTWVLLLKSIYRSDLQVRKRLQEWNGEFDETDRPDSSRWNYEGCCIRTNGLQHYIKAFMKNAPRNDWVLYTR